MGVTEQDILAALDAVHYPGFSRSIVSFGIVRDVEIEVDQVRLRLELGAGNPAVAEKIREEVCAVVAAMDGVEAVQVLVGSTVPPPGLSMAGRPAPSPGSPPGLHSGLIPGVRHVVAVASAKGGVGKSTVAVNLAVALAQKGKTVGLMDADIYGPSIPLMMGVTEKPNLDSEGRRLLPFERHGVRFMSLGFLVDRESAVIWRGPMVMKAIEQLLRDVAWGELDVLVVDMPPGTGDAQLTLSQRIRLAGSVIVTTPQDVALADAIKGVAMFRKVGVPVLGMVENMSFFVCPHCDERTQIFGHGGGKREAERLQVPFLGEIPLDPAIRASGDAGLPIASADPESPRSKKFLEIAAVILDVLGDDESCIPEPGDLLQHLPENRHR